MFLRWIVDRAELMLNASASQPYLRGAQTLGCMLRDCMFEFMWMIGEAQAWVDVGKTAGHGFGFKIVIMGRGRVSHSLCLLTQGDRTTYRPCVAAAPHFHQFSTSAVQTDAKTHRHPCWANGF